MLEHGEEFQAAVITQELEGSIAKLRASRYEPGRRSRSWLKIKARREQELVVIGYEPGKGSHADLGALLVATREGSAWRYAGEVGSGLDGRTRTLMRHLLDEHAVEEPPVPDVPPVRGVRWSEPRHVIRAEFTEWTTDGLLRQASFKGREIGRDPTSVSRERVEPAAEARAKAVAKQHRSATLADEAPPTVAEPTTTGRGRVPAGEGRRGTRRAYRRGADVTASPMKLVRTEPDPETPARSVTAAELDALRALGKGGRWKVGGHAVDLTNLDKVLFPRSGFTKRDLVVYYTTIAPVLMPYLAGRPLNVHRWPDGIEGKTQFWQKQIPSHAPDWVARWDYPEAGHDQSHTYVVADRVATMAWLANQAVIDLHPWTSTTADYWRPTYALIDIDPGEKTTWPELLTLARLYRTALDHLGVSRLPEGHRQARRPDLGAGRAALHLRRDARLGRGALARGRGGRARPGLVGMGQGRSRWQGAPRLHAERDQQDTRRAVRRAARPQRCGLRADHLGGARRRHAQTRCLGHARDRGARREGRGPLQGLPR